jgi:SAM-dependent methyltransferase
MASSWIAYNELAWTDDLLGHPEAHEAEVTTYVELIRRAAGTPPKTLLHLGSGGGHHDRVFKRHFTVTGVDLSLGMLERARAAHPDIEYVEGDLRSVRLHRQFDAVAIPDCIDYMATLEDLRRAIATAAEHLVPGGVLLVVAKPAETLRNNNFAYSGEAPGVHVTVFESNYVDPSRPHVYEATLVYLIRRQGELTIRTDRHFLGVFPRSTWDQVFADAGFAMQATTLDGVYDDYLIGEGEYPLTVFVGQRGGASGST